jgi:DNA-binding IscR family transcriptional regulator
VNGLWIQVRDAIGGVLDAVTLADLAPRPRPRLVTLDARSTDAVPV